MAKIGLKYPVYKGESTQGVIAKAIQADIAIETNDIKLYADDVIAESDRSFKSGKVTLGVDDLSDAIQTAFLGHAVGTIPAEIIASGTDTSPYVGVGFYGLKLVAGVKKYRAIWLPKVQFGEPADANTTKGETLAFGTASLEGTIMLDDTGAWKYEQTFTVEAAARTYLEGKAGIVVIP